MNELENQLAEVVKKGLEVAQQTGNFIIEQAPELLQEFYMWHITKSILGIVVGITIIFLCYKLFQLCGKKEDEDYHNTKILNRFYETDEIPFIFLSLSTGFVTLIMFISIIVDIFTLLKILVAPKLYLIEYFIK